MRVLRRADAARSSWTSPGECVYMPELQDYSDNRDSVAVQTLDANVRRGQWATAALAAFGYFAVIAAIFIGLREVWSVWTVVAKTAVLACVLLVTYLVAFGAERAGNVSVAKLFACFATIFFGFALAALSSLAPRDPGAEGAALQLLTDACPDVAPFWALGAFALALACHARILHFVAVALILFWLVVDSTQFAALIAIVYCALGEYWAWRRKSACVATLYFSLCAFVVCVEPSLWTKKETWALVAVACSALIYWTGANFNNAPMRGIALIIATCALLVVSFPQYWEKTLDPEILEKYGKNQACWSLAGLGACAFVAYSVNLTLSGAQRCTPNFILGIAAIFVWTVAYTFVASREWRPSVAVGILLGVAAVFFGLVWVERNLRVRKSKNECSALATRRNVADDALTDDPEFDDVIEWEARRALNAEPILEIARVYGRFIERVENALRRPCLVAAVSLQFVLLLLNLSRK